MSNNKNNTGNKRINFGNTSVIYGNKKNIDALICYAAIGAGATTYAFAYVGCKLIVGAIDGIETAVKKIKTKKPAEQ